MDILTTFFLDMNTRVQVMEQRQEAMYGRQNEVFDQLQQMRACQENMATSTTLILHLCCLITFGFQTYQLSLFSLHSNFLLII